MRTAPLLAIQHGLESLYRVETNLDVQDFLLTAEQRSHFQGEPGPREQLLLRQQPDGLDLALYVETEALDALSRHDPRDGVDDRNLAPLLLALEGVSHFIYTVDRARSERTLSALELELQAEVDKYVSLVLLTWEALRPLELIERLFVRVRYRDDLSEEERERYTTANAMALAYAQILARRFLSRRALPGFLAEVRRFWRLSCAAKMQHIKG